MLLEMPRDRRDLRIENGSARPAFADRRTGPLQAARDSTRLLDIQMTLHAVRPGPPGFSRLGPIRFAEQTTAGFANAVTTSRRAAWEIRSF